MQKKVRNFVEAGQLGIFANGYWGHPAYKLPPEANLMALAHYLEALAWQRDVAQLHAIFGGKNPHRISSLAACRARSACTHSIRERVRDRITAAAPARLRLTWSACRK